MRIIGVDTGNACMKTANYTFVSGLTAHADIKPAISTEVLFYEGNYYSLNPNRLPYTKNKTENENYFILTLFAMAKELLRDYKASPSTETPIHEDVVLAMGLPPSHMGSKVTGSYDAAALKDLYKPYFSNEGKVIKFVYKEQAFEINVVDVMVYPQGIAAVVNRLSEFRTIPVLHVIDIGGYTTDIVTLNSGELYAGGYQSLTNFGIIQLVSRIKTKVENTFGGTLNDVQVESILRIRESEEDYEFPKEVVQLVFDTASEYVKDFFKFLVQSGIDLTLTPSIFIGGGSKLLRRYIALQKITKPEFVKNLNANVCGYEWWARRELDG